MRLTTFKLILIIVGAMIIGDFIGVFGFIKKAFSGIGGGANG